tara:strand:- start:99 stop:530 length:432 start_codon:yes stop_codon:yes gene_type:complete
MNIRKVERTIIDVRRPTMSGIRKELSDRERMDAEEFAPEDMNRGRREQIREQIRKLHRAYLNSDRSGFDKRITILEKAGSLFDSANMPKNFVSPNHSEKANLENFRAFIQRDRDDYSDYMWTLDRSGQFPKSNPPKKKWNSVD